MRTALAALTLVVLVPAAAAAPPFGSQWATAAADPATAGSRTALTVTLVICQSIAQGTLRIRFTAAAGLTNPARAGSYSITARIGNRTFRPRLAIH
jgi:hypothetical protein